jgi:murein DD-endopeptidase MepM/ murein hydrolase activator NlpD
MIRRQKKLIVSLVFLCLFSLCYANGNYYIIQKGDNLYRVAKRFNVPLDVLLKVNGIQDPTELKVGMKIIIPGVHIVQKGETLYSLAKTYGISVNELMKLNHISDPSRLKVGQQLVVPGEADTVPEQNNSSVTYTDLGWPHPGKREAYNSKLQGILICGKKGDIIYSVSSGKVIWSGPYRGFGNIVIVDSGQGLIFGYLGNESVSVKVGEVVEAGTAIGTMGAYLHQTQAKLLFIVFDKQKREFLNPNILYKN